MTRTAGDFIQTFTGIEFYPLDPRPEDICIEDIAHALAMTCRYNGHCRYFYSVAEHSVLLACHTPLKHRMAALFHDASEAYLCDVPRPVKHGLPGYVEAENKLLAVIAEKFGFELPLPEIVKENDTRILHDEVDVLLQPCSWIEDFPGEALGVQLRCWDPRQAESAFLEIYYTLNEKVRRV